MDIYHLFPPIDDARAKERAKQLRCQAVQVSTAILEDLLSSLPLHEEEETHKVEGVDLRSSLDVETTADDYPMEVGVEPVTCKEEGVEPVTNEERLADRELRLRIYLGLLNLACAMVRSTGTTAPVLVLKCFSADKKW